jgi:hypothetical protein
MISLLAFWCYKALLIIGISTTAGGPNARTHTTANLSASRRGAGRREYRRRRGGLQRRRLLHDTAGVLRGKAGIQQAFTNLLSDIPQAKWNLKMQLYENDVLLLEWTADSAKTKIDDGIDTFVFKDGLIRAQIVRYTLQKK